MKLARGQHQIVSKIERYFSVADAIEKTDEQSFTQSERLRKSILKGAFEGKLVEQDESDEPAERLLERIKVERERRRNGDGVKKRGKGQITKK